MKKNLYIHIGIGKTGTSAIQKMLFDSRFVLSAKDYYVPLSGLADNKVGHHNLAVYTEEDVSKVTAAVYSELLEEISKVEESNIIISSENFIYCKHDYIKSVVNLLKNYNVKILVFVREQIKLIESSYLFMQSQGWDYKYNINKYYEFYRGAYNYVWLINKWRNHLVEGSIIAYVYDKSIMRHGIGRYFFSKIDKSMSADLVTTDRLVNKSILPIYSEIISYMDRYPLELGSHESNTIDIRKMIISRFLDISDLNESYEKVSKTMDGIKSLMEKELGGDFEKRDNLYSMIDDLLKNILINGMRKDLMDRALYDDILNYYHMSNMQFSKNYLDRVEESVFMKNNMEL